MPTTTNFGWTTPADTDLVKDGAAAIRTLGSNIDTSLVDLKGGTTGQYLQKNSGTDLDYVWADVSAGSMTLLSTTALSGTTTTVSSISGSYKNLIIQVLGAQANIEGALMMRLNSNTTSNYRNSYVSVGESSWNASTGQNKQNLYVGDPTTANNNFVQIEIPNYALSGTGKAYIQYGLTPTGSPNFSWGVNENITAAITSVTIFENDGNTFTGGTIYIYGVN